MIQPTQEQLESLSRTERAAYKIADWVNRHLKVPLIWWNRSFMFFIIWLCLGRRLKVHHLERVTHLNNNARVILAANHRTFFDFFVITWVNYTYTSLSRRIFFPVRSTFFYDRIIGIILNFIMGCYSMFPPIMRSKEKKIFNQYSLARVNAELKDQGVIIGFHPEGTRNKNPNYTTLLPARHGIGEVIHNADEAIVIPVFIAGPTNDVIREFFINWFKAKQNPVVVYYGSPIKTTDLANGENNRENFQLTADGCMTHIQNLAEEFRQEYQSVYPIICND